MTKRKNILLLSITTLVALALLGITISFVIRSNAQGEESGQNVRAYLNSPQPLVIILAEPEYRSVVASIQEHGTPIIVTEYLRRSGEDWYRIDINETESGWVQGQYISLERP
ncbi:MAG: SH3 domain-containing protein [Anaerolineae bacterium]|nr:SH3 domain-containing protein [Anaerolineae bacterium]MBT7072660.1 SH3 domain-containing protein [Anaerolineae bacterium]MBT7324911.1 SH3 domain-containing protein [Anaerolineae bacterium]